MSRLIRRVVAVLIVLACVVAWWSTYLELYGLKVAVAGVLVTTGIVLALAAAWGLWSLPPAPIVEDDDLEVFPPARGRRRAEDGWPWDDEADRP